MNDLLIDLESGADLHGDRESAETLLRLFMQELAPSVREILQLHTSNQFPELYDRVHSLCGAACYSSTPKLLGTLKQLNAMLSDHAHHPNKDKLDGINALVMQLEQDYLGTAALYEREHKT